MATPLSTISDAAVRDYTNETVTAVKLENDPANIKVAVNLILDYLAENEVNFNSATQPTDTANGMTWMNATANALQLRRSGAWETVLSEGTAGTASIAAGGGTAKGIPVLKVFHSFTSVSAAGATGALIYATIPASTLNASGHTLVYRGWGVKSGASSAASIKPFWNAAALTTHSMSAACTDWFVEVTISYVSSGGQKWVSVMTLNRDDTGSTTLVKSGTAAATATTAIAFGLEVSAVGALDTISESGCYITWF